MTALPDRPPARVIRAAEAEAWQDGFAFRDRARDEARALRDSVASEIAAAREEGRQEGRRQGEAEAAEMLLRSRAQIDAYLATLQPQLVALVDDILREILDGSSDADLIARATTRALRDYRDRQGITLSVPSDRLAEVEARLAGLDLRIAADRHLTGRQCILTGPASSIDISIDAQLQTIRAAMDAA